MISKKIKKFLRENTVFLSISEKILDLQNSRFLPVSAIFTLLSSTLYLILQDNYYKLLLIIRKRKFIKKHPLEKVINKKSFFSRFAPEIFFLKVIHGDKSVSPNDYLNILNKSNLNEKMQLIWSQRFLDLGRPDLARTGFLELIKCSTNASSNEIKLQAWRYLGIISFLSGKNEEANYYWKSAGHLRRTMFTLTTPRRYRILGLGWIAAFGHIAMLDYYLKYIKLFFAKEEIRIIAPWPPELIPAKELMKKLVPLGITMIHPDDLENDYDIWAKKHRYPTWNQLAPAERAALTDDFWEYDFPDGEILGYAHALSRIQSTWEEVQNPPLFTLSQDEREIIDKYLDNFGIPRNAWYVCLHVREPGFHQEWNHKYPSLRDANIANYHLAIEKIVNAGGWVLRMGDPSMKPLPPMPNVIDYAHSAYKTPTADILLAAGARFMLGTNSGYANICSMYNVPSALTNWVPLGWPLWLSQDLMIPKLFRNKESGEYLSVEQIFEKGLAFLQNWSDLPADIELIENTPEEIAEITIEILNRCNRDNKKHHPQTEKLLSLKNYYKHIAKSYNAFTGSQLADHFLQRHFHIFKNADSTLDTNYEYP